jgi:hypothetical protein
MKQRIKPTTPEMALKTRSAILACVAKNDPTRFKARSVTPEKLKLIKSRARRKTQLQKEQE